MISLVIAVMMIAQMLSPLTGGLLETAFGWRAIFYLITAASLTITVVIVFMLPETRRERAAGSSFRRDIGGLVTSRAFRLVPVIPPLPCQCSWRTRPSSNASMLLVPTCRPSGAKTSHAPSQKSKARSGSGEGASCMA
jgi:MFS family permease